jgi:hypothetical protein
MVRGISTVIRIVVLILSVAAVAVPARADVVQIGSFSGADGVYSYVDGTLSGTMSGDYTFDPQFVAIFTTLPTTTYLGATLEVSATRTGDVFSAGTSLAQPMNGFLEVRDSGGTLLVRADFTGGYLFGVLNDITMSLQASDPSFGSIITYSSDVFDALALIPPSAVRLDLNPVVPRVGLDGTGDFKNFEGIDTANFSSTVDESLIPEPATMSLLGVGVVSVLVRRRRHSTK